MEPKALETIPVLVNSQESLGEPLRGQPAPKSHFTNIFSFKKVQTGTAIFFGEIQALIRARGGAENIQESRTAPKFTYNVIRRTQKRNAFHI